jgi:hypothetical protein
LLFDLAISLAACRHNIQTYKHFQRLCSRFKDVFLKVQRSIHSLIAAGTAFTKSYSQGNTHTHTHTQNTHTHTHSYSQGNRSKIVLKTQWVAIK